MDDTTALDLPTECRKCGQALFLLAPGRDVCERCRMGRTIFPETPEEKAAREAAIPPPPERPKCTVCDRNTTDDGYVLGLADGICLSCRIQSS